MATVTHAATATWSTTGGNTTNTFTPALFDLIVVVTGSTGVTTASVTDNNTDGHGQYTQIGATRTGFSTSGNLQIWIRNSVIGSATSTIVTASQSGSTGGGLDCYRVAGMRRTGATAARSNGGQSTGGAGNTPAPVLSLTPLTGNPIITAVCNGANPAGVTQPTSYTEPTNVGYNTPTTGMNTAFINSGITNATITWGTASASIFASLAIELDTSAPQAGPVFVPQDAVAPTRYRIPQPPYIGGRPGLIYGSVEYPAAVTIDSSTPAIASSSSGSSVTSVTTASFSPPAGTLLVAMCVVNYNISPGVFPAITISDSASGVWNTGPYAANLSGPDIAVIFTRYCATAPGSITVTMSRGSDSSQAELQLAVRVCDNASPVQNLAGTGVNNAAATGNATVTLNLTTPRSACFVCAGQGGNTQAVPNSATTTIQITHDPSDGGYLLFGNQNPFNTFAPAAVTLGWTGGESGSSGAVAAMEILPAPVANDISAGTGRVVWSQGAPVVNPAPGPALTWSNPVGVRSIMVREGVIIKSQSSPVTNPTSGPQLSWGGPIGVRAIVIRAGVMMSTLISSVSFPKTATLTDTFLEGSLNLTLWNQSTIAGTTITYDSRGAVITYPASTTSSAYAQIESNGQYDLTNSYVYLKVTGVTTSTSSTYCGLSVAAQTPGNSIVFQAFNGTLQLEYFLGGVQNVVGSITYVPSTMVWWRIREASGTIFWDTSADGINWTNQASVADPFVPNDVNVFISSGATGTATSPGQFIFEDFNTPPTAPFFAFTAPVKSRIPQWHPRAGRIGSSFGAPVINPIHGPPFFPFLQPVRSRIPRPFAGSITVEQTGPAVNAALNGSGFGNGIGSGGAPVINPTAGPVFRQFTQPARSRQPLPARGRVYVTRTPVVIFTPSPGPTFFPFLQPVRARLPQQPFLKGRIRSNAGGPVINPTAGPVFRQSVQPIRSRIPQTFSKGRVRSNPGTAVYTGPQFFPFIRPVRSPVPKTFSKGRVYSNAGAPVRNPTTGPAFVPFLQAVRVKLQVPFLKGRVYRNPGGPVVNPTAGPVFIQAVKPIRSVIPQVFSKGRIRSNPGTAVYTGPVFYPAVKPIRSPVPLAVPFLKGRVYRNSGAPVINPTAGPAFRQAVHPIRAVIPQTFSKGRIRSSAGGPVQNPPGPGFQSRSFPSQARIPQTFSKGRVYKNAGAPVVNPTTGPAFHQATAPIRIRPSLPPRGRVWSNPGGPVNNPVFIIGPPFFPFRQPVRIHPTLPPRGHIYKNAGAPVVNPTPGPVFRPFLKAVRAAQPLPPRGRVYSNKGAAVYTGPVFQQATHPIKARLPVPFLKGRVYSNAGVPQVHAGPPFIQLNHPVQAKKPLFRLGRVESNPGVPQVQAGPVFIQLNHPVQAKKPLFRTGRVASNPGIPFIHVGPVFQPAVQPIRAKLPVPFLKGRIRSNPGGPDVTRGPVFTQITHPVRAQAPAHPRGWIASNSGTITTRPVTQSAIFIPQGLIRAKAKLPPRGRISFNVGAPVRNPTHGPPVYPLLGPIIARQPLPRRGRAGAGGQGGPVQNPPTGSPVFIVSFPRSEWQATVSQSRWSTGGMSRRISI